MPKSSGFRLHITAPARRDITAIDRYTGHNFGEAAADRYDVLIRQALRDIRDDPNQPGTRSRPGILHPDFKLYHLSSSRERVNGQLVKEPRHFIIFRVQSGVIEVLRVLHDSRDLSLHLPAVV